MSKLIKELKDFFYFFKLPKSKKQIVFYSEHGGYRASFEGIIRALVDEYGQHIVYITSDINDPMLDISDKGITPLYINKILPFFMPLVDSKVFIMTLTDLDNSYLKRSKNPVHYIYVFHALVSTTMMYNFGAFDHYDSILCVGSHQIKEIRKQEKLYMLKEKKLIQAGYYRLEKIRNSFQEHKLNAGESKDKKKTVLIAPSWGEDNVLESYGQDLIYSLLDSGYNVIARPHAETIRRFPAFVERLGETFGGNPGFKLDRSNVSDESMIAADILISDCSGIALEYAFGTERPVIFMDVPLKVKNPRYKEIGIEPIELFLRPKIGKIVSPADIKTLPLIIESMISERERYKKEIMRLGEILEFNRSGSSRIGAEYIVALL